MSEDDQKQNPTSQDATAEAKEVPHQDVDWFLQLLVAVSNDSGLRVPITISTSGMLITGLIISGREYFDEFARLYEETFKTSLHKDVLAGAVGHLKRYGEMYGAAPPGVQGPPFNPDPRYIHLRDARIILHDQGGVPINTGILWRARLETIDGFWMGMLRETERQETNL